MILSLRPPNFLHFEAKGGKRWANFGKKKLFLQNILVSFGKFHHTVELFVV